MGTILSRADSKNALHALLLEGQISGTQHGNGFVAEYTVQIHCILCHKVYSGQAWPGADTRTAHHDTAMNFNSILVWNGVYHVD